MTTQQFVAALLGGVIAAILTGGVNLFVNFRLFSHQRALEKRKDDRALRDAKLNRLRRDYRVLLQIASLRVDLVQQLELLMDQPEDVWKRAQPGLSKQWDTLYPDMNPAVFAASLEGDNQEIIMLNEKATEIFDKYMEPRSSKYGFTIEQCRLDVVELKSIMDTIEIKMKEHFSSVEQSVPE